MIKVSVHNLKGDKVSDLELSEKVFGLKSNDSLVHQAYVTIASNLRQNLAHTKTRSERIGSGRKPWKQKGTGNARVGDRQSPIWRKGGVVFGPRNERNYSKDMNKKMKRRALMVALSDKIRNEEILVVDELTIKDKKTQEFAKALKSLSINGKSILVGFNEKDVENALYSRNLPKVDNIYAKDLNVLELLNHKYLLISKDSIKDLEEKFINQVGE